MAAPKSEQRPTNFIPKPGNITSQNLSKIAHLQTQLNAKAQNIVAVIIAHVSPMVRCLIKVVDNKAKYYDFVKEWSEVRQKLVRKLLEFESCKTEWYAIS